MSKDFDCRYVAHEDQWIVISPTELVMPPETIKLIRDAVRARWLKEMMKLNPITDGSKLEFVRKAVAALDAGRIAQIFIKAKGDIPLFTSTEGTGAIYG